MIPQDTPDRGQVGIGTLIVFIAMVIVAAIAAGVLITAAGTLQTQSAQASQESADQVSNRLQVVTATGSDISGEKVNHFNLTVSLSPSASEADLSEGTIQWSGPNGTFNLVHNQSGDPSDGDGNFYTYEVKDDDDSNPVLNARDDRLLLHINATEIGAGAVPSGSSVELRFTTRSGGTTIVGLRLPSSVSGEVSVQLKL